ncbi:MAG: mannose-1-phosphate guanylyltransferase [Saprospiraceae bacterium]|nr:mannose-1-phosphate guanylyltransferase [Saprospiraceae bacterium]
MLSQNTYVAIMAGGVGSRFWPASRVAKPKQFLDILGVGKSLLQMTFDRFLALCPAENIFIVTNAIYRDLVKAQLPELTDNQILLEPSRNNTAPCIAYTAFKLQELNPNANLIVAPSDHIILKETNFIITLQKALDFTAKNDALVTLGIQPSRPDTGYGYINFEKTAVQNDVHQVIKFTEKPPLEKAEAFLASGDYLWNAGIFVWRVQTILSALEQNASEIHTILGAKLDCYNTPQEQAFIDEYYPTTPNISIDFAVMEKANNVYTIPSDFGWSDLGTWASLHAESQKDNHNNTCHAGEVMLMETDNCLIHAANSKLVVIKDLQNYIVVDEPDVLLIYPMGQEQEIKQITEQLKTKKKDKYL